MDTKDVCKKVGICVLGKKARIFVFFEENALKTTFVQQVHKHYDTTNFHHKT